MNHTKFSSTEYQIDLTGKTAIVTGAARGIGYTIARALARAGANVLAVDRLESVKTDPGKDMGAQGYAAEGYVADISSPRSVDDMVKACLYRFGTPDILLNIAAISRPVPVQDMGIDAWKETMDVNLTSVFLCTRAVLPHMVEQKRGCILNFSSIVAQTGGVTSAHYSAAKAGVEGFSRSLAREVAPKGIRVNVIAPGMIDTPMLDLMPEAQKQKLASRVPLQRIGTPDDLIGPVMLLVSDGGAYITGQTLAVNGGQSMG